MPANQTIHEEPNEPIALEDDEAEDEIDRLAADDEEEDGFADDELSDVPPELAEQILEARRDLDAEEPDALARHALEVAVGNDE